MTDHGDGPAPFDEKFRALMVRRLPLATDFDGELTFADLGVSSISVVGFFIAIEEVYDVQLPEEAILAEGFGTPRSLCAVVREAVESSSAGLADGRYTAHARAARGSR